jgi:copper homeostasis protein
MPGSGINPENAGALIQKTGLQELHGTFRSRISSKMQYRNEQLSRQEEEYGLLQTDFEAIGKCIDVFSIGINEQRR